MSYNLRRNCLKSSIYLLCLLVFQSVHAQNWSEIAAVAESKKKVLGDNWVMVVWHKDTIAFKKESGDFNSKTVVPIASCSKWLTAALVMLFVEEGKIDLEDKVANYLPEFARYNKNYITIRQCLSHYTGIKEPSTAGKLLGAKKYASLEEEVNAFAAREIRTNPGEDFVYGEMGINIAARVLEVVSKKKFDVLIKQRLFTPLGMKKTSFSSADFSKAPDPSAGAVSNADDYIIFLAMLLNKGKFKGKQLLSEESVNTLLTVQTKPEQIKFAPKVAAGFAYALGAWVIEQSDGKATTIACPGLFGSWPMVDYCRGYAYLVITKSLLGEAKADAHMEMKKLIEEEVKSKCK